MLAWDIFIHHLLLHEKDWPALADMRDESEWSFPITYKRYARTLLSVALLRRTPELASMRLTLQKARAMTCAGLAHLFHKETLCLQRFTLVSSGLYLGPNPELGETEENYYPTREELRDFYLDAPRSENEYVD
jgi:hypothetical protein